MNKLFYPKDSYGFCEQTFNYPRADWLEQIIEKVSDVPQLWALVMQLLKIKLVERKLLCAELVCTSLCMFICTLKWLQTHRNHEYSSDNFNKKSSCHSLALILKLITVRFLPKNLSLDGSIIFFVTNSSENK